MARRIIGAWAAAAAFALLGGAATGFDGFRLLALDGYFVKWNDAAWGRGSVVTYAVLNGALETAEARNCGRMQGVESILERNALSDDAFRGELHAALGMWEAVADITFVEAKDVRTADIVIGAQSDPVGRAFANVAFAHAGAATIRQIERSLVCLNPTMPWKIGFDGNLEVYDLRYTLAHEIGHAIGLDHPSRSGQLMSYRYDERFRSLQAGDVSGAVAIYGMRVKDPAKLKQLGFGAG